MKCYLLCYVWAVVVLFVSCLLCKPCLVAELSIISTHANVHAHTVHTAEEIIDVQTPPEASREME